ncbi:nuclear transport factor 2 family protein [Pseudoxanthomonas sp. Root630]|uniref:nuclear transport factor 2 family protein n=1 Tax=Pseudoxanthomonas sp. Root630 TaxID=1736574 RepID=UPI0009D7155F|nr:nuclear transport factor 2 family protein [Pseudoxanthomonas sp. Root630]
MDDLLAELTALETELHHPGVTCTRARLERLLHPDFHEVGRSGTRYTRQVVIDFLADRVSLPDVVACDHRIERLSDDVALLHFASHEVATDGAPAKSPFACRYGGARPWASNCIITRARRSPPQGVDQRRVSEAVRHSMRKM